MSGDARARRAAVVLVAAAGVFGTAVPDALAITKKQAETVALRTLRPQAQPGRVVLFGLPKALAARQSVAAASPARLGLKPRKRGLKAVGRKAWLFWLDLDYQARFEHASVLLVVDDRTGRVLRRQRIAYYPLVDGARPAFLRTRAAYNGSRYRVFAKNLRPANRATAAAIPTRTTALPPNAFKDDCVLMIGAWNDALFERDFVDTERIMESLGVRTFWTSTTATPARTRPKEHGKVSSLSPNVGSLVRDEACKDVLLYVSAHGTERTRLPGVVVDEGESVLPGDLADVIKEHPNITFKIKIDACYSGRFREDRGLNELANLVLLETSSAAGEKSYGALTHQETSVPNPGRGEFTHSNLVGITRFVQSDAEIAAAQTAGGSLFVRMLERAFTLGADADAARRAGLTHPELPRVNLAGTQPALEIRVWAYHPPNSDFSYLCIAWTTVGAKDLRLSYFGGERGDSSETTLQLSEPFGARNGVTALRILAPGTYRVGATLFTPSGQRLDQTVTVDVTSSQGGPPCGG